MSPSSQTLHGSSRLLFLSLHFFVNLQEGDELKCCPILVVDGVVGVVGEEEEFVLMLLLDMTDFSHVSSH